MRRVIVGIGLLAIAAACFDDDSTGVEPDEVFGALMVGDEEVPPVETDAVGETLFITDGTTVDYQIVVTDIVEVTAAHIHEGEVGENGPILVTLLTANPPVTVAVEDTIPIVQDFFTAPDEGVDMTMNELLELMRSGGAYVNVHTEENRDGEIRGQIVEPSE